MVESDARSAHSKYNYWEEYTNKGAYQYIFNFFLSILDVIFNHVKINS